MTDFVDFDIKDICKKSYRELNLDLYKKLYLVRSVETSIRKYYDENDMKTPMHMSMGEDAIVVGVCHALGSRGQIFATYRSHAAFLAKTQDIDYFFAEMYAKDTSPIKGKGGSMHLCYSEKDFMGTSAIVASNIPVAVGASFANKMKGIDKIVCVFFGDGAIDEGVFWESLNIACIKRLPIIFVCEDNGLAVHTSISIRRGYNSIVDIISKFDCFVLESDSTDVKVIYDLASQAAEYTRGIGPVFMNLKYYRYLEHVGINEDFDTGYRSKEEFEKWYNKDPIKLQRLKLLDLGIENDKIEEMEKEINDKISQSIFRAKNALLSNCKEAYKDVFK